MNECACCGIPIRNVTTYHGLTYCEACWKSIDAWCGAKLPSDADVAAAVATFRRVAAISRVTGLMIQGYGRWSK